MFQTLISVVKWPLYFSNNTLTAGTCHAENDEDKKAIVSLRRSVEEDPYNIDSLLALGTR